MFFEKYQRYKNTQLIINSIRNGNAFSIAEINADNENMLSRFLPDDSIANIGKDFNADDICCDIAVFINNTEDFSSEEFIKLMKKTEKIASKIFIIGAAFSDYNVNLANMMSNANSRIYMKSNNPYFTRNIYKGFIDLESAAKNIESSFDILSMGTSYIRDIIHSMYIMAAENEDLKSYAALVNEHYNNVTFQNDYLKEGYLKMIIGKKETGIRTYQSLRNRPDMEFYRNHYNIFSNMYNKYVSEKNKSYFSQKIESAENHIAAEVEKIKSKLSKPEKYIEINVTYEDNTVSRKYALKTEGFSIDVDTKNAKKIEIRPLNGICAVELKKFRIKKNGVYEDAAPSSNVSEKYDNCYIFENDRPEFFIELEDSESVSFSFSYLSENISGMEYIKRTYEKIDSLNKNIENLNRKVKNIQYSDNEKLSQKDEEIGIVKNNNAELKTKIKELERLLSRRNKELNEIKNSKVWKMSSIFRKQ